MKRFLMLSALLPCLCLGRAAFAKSPRSRVAPEPSSGAAVASSPLPGEPAVSAEQAALKRELHEVSLQARRARYALRKARSAGDGQSARSAQERLDQAKERRKALRARLRALIRAQSPRESKSGSRAPRRGTGPSGAQGRSAR